MKASEIPESIRAEMDGKGAEPQTFKEWMRERTPGERAELFGARNAERWERGAITQVEILRQAGNEISVSKLSA